MSDELHLDLRLQEKSIRDGKLSRGDLAKATAAIEDTSANLLAFDDQGNPTNAVTPELKTLELKTAEPALYEKIIPDDLIPDILG